MGRLREIQEEMLNLLEEARSLVSRKSKTHRMTYERMKAYWHGHIQMALTDDHMYLGSGGATMQEAVNDIEGNGDSVADLVEYAGEDFDVEKLRLEVDPDMPEGSTLEQVIEHALSFHDADTIRDDIDKVNNTDEDE